MRAALVVALIAVLGVTVAAEGQQGAEGVRMIRAWTEPAAPPFAEPAMVNIELRVAPGVLVFMPDTLNVAAEMASVGTGRWSVAAAGGDSLVISANYPVIGYRKGIQELPKLEVALASAAATTEERVIRLDEARGRDVGELLTTVIPLGSTTIGEYAAVDDPGENAAVVPRPPADVLGGEWSIWMILAVGLASATGVGAIGTLLPRFWSGRGSSWMARLRGRSAKQQALNELDRVKSLGLHLDGRVDDFYASSSATLRQYAAHLHPDCSPALTTTELLALLETKGTPARVQHLSGPLATAELAKFGTLRPDSGTAEKDWSAMRQWVASSPER